MKHLLIAFLIIGLSACTQSRGFDRGQLRNQITTPTVVTEAEIKDALDLQPQLPNPFKLALYFSPSEVQPGTQFGWNWRGEDKDQILEVKNDLDKHHVISEIMPLPDSLVAGDDLKAIRLAAARSGADAVLVVNGVSDVDRYNNALGATYALLITPFFVPGTHVDSLFMVNATMWDVRNEYLYLSVETEGLARETGAAFSIYEKKLIHEAKANALTGLRSEMAIRLSNMNKQFTISKNLE